tara:strand:- start:1188 stop:1439 length:252 start_codon:yes stop_codon:yes gene_type:complete
MSNKTFGEWLSDYDGRDEGVRDLREEYLQTRRVYPRGVRTIITPIHLYNEMRLFSGCTGAIEALVTASKLYGQPLPTSIFEGD